MRMIVTIKTEIPGVDLVIGTEIPGIDAVDVSISIPLPEGDVKDLIQELHKLKHNLKTDKINFSIKEYEIGEKYVKIKASFVDEDKIDEQPRLEVGIQKDALESAFEQIRKLLQLSSELDLYPTLKGAALVISSVKGELHLNKKKLTELITENS